MFDEISDNELKQTVSALWEVGVNPKIIYDELIKLLPEALDPKKLSANYDFLLKELNLSAFEKPTHTISKVLGKITPNESYNYNRKN